VIVKVKEVAEKSKGGIVVAVDKKMERMLTRGNDCRYRSRCVGSVQDQEQFAGLKVGDRVFYAKYAGKWIADPET
jgi:co-chaperonin GroES (HSP10)